LGCCLKEENKKKVATLSEANKKDVPSFCHPSLKRAICAINAQIESSNVIFNT
jgi:hypothetical protein